MRFTCLSRVLSKIITGKPWKQKIIVLFTKKSEKKTNLAWILGMMKCPSFVLTWLELFEFRIVRNQKLIENNRSCMYPRLPPFKSRKNILNRLESLKFEVRRLWLGPTYVSLKWRIFKKKKKSQILKFLGVSNPPPTPWTESWIQKMKPATCGNHYCLTCCNMHQTLTLWPLHCTGQNK